MKLSTKQQLLKEANSELKRLRKLAGLSESKKPLNEAIAFVKGQRVNVPSRYIMKCHTATPDKYVYGNSMYKVGDFVGTDGKPTKDLQKAQIFDKEDADMWEDTYTTSEIEKYSKAIREPDFNGVYSLGAFFKPVAFKMSGLSESKSKLKEVALDGSKISYKESEYKKISNQYVDLSTTLNRIPRSSQYILDEMGSILDQYDENYDSGKNYIDKSEFKDLIERVKELDDLLLKYKTQMNTFKQLLGGHLAGFR